MEIIKTNDGYMIEAANGDYIHDTDGDNLFDTYAQAQALINQLELNHDLFIREFSRRGH